MKKVEPIKDKADIRRMLDYLEGQSMRDAILFRLGLNTILRVSDLLQLKVSDFYTLGGKFRTHVTLKESKTGKVKKIKLNRVSRKIIPNHIQHYHLSGDDFLFFPLRTQISQLIDIRLGDCSRRQRFTVG